tara:strand:- start:455 stop:790 length:336 start_codon:yes stop_codon:yes gene_type:complete
MTTQNNQMTMIDLTKGWDADSVITGPYMASVVAPIAEANEQFIPTYLCTWEITAQIRWSIDPQNINVGTGTDDVLVYELQINEGAKQTFESREELEAAYKAAVAAKREEIA